MINDQFNNSDQLKNIFSQYQRKNLLTNLDELRHQLKHGAIVDVQHQLSQNNLKAVQLVDDDQIDCFIQQICREVGGMTTTSILGLGDDAPQYQDPSLLNEQEQWENMKNLIQKRITKEELQILYLKEEENQRQKLIQMYKETKIDQFEVDRKRGNKMNTMTLKKVQEAQTKKFDSIDEVELSKTSYKSRFIRSPKKYIQVASPVKILKDCPAMILSPLLRLQTTQGIKLESNVNSPLKGAKLGYFVGLTTTKVSTKVSTKVFDDDRNTQSVIKLEKYPSQYPSHKKTPSLPFESYVVSPLKSQINTRPASSIKKKSNFDYSLINTDHKDPVNMIQDFIGICQTTEQNSQQSKTQMKRRINGLEGEVLYTIYHQFKKLAKQLHMISSIQMNEDDDHNEQFEDFQAENKFKKKLLTFLMNRTHNKTEILSKKKSEQNMKKIIESML